MRLFKWSPEFRCNEESPIVPVWISLPFLPMHLINCKNALMSIAAVVGKPLRFDQATAILNRPNVARVLVECDVSMPLRKNIRIVDGDKEFIQDIVYEKIPKYCYSCKHLGHIHSECFIANPSSRELPKENRAPETDKGKEKVTENHPMPQYVPKSKTPAQTDIPTVASSSTTVIPTPTMDPILSAPLIATILPDTVVQKETVTVASSSTTVIPTPTMGPILPAPLITTTLPDTMVQKETVPHFVVTTNLQSEDIPSNHIGFSHSAVAASTNDDLGSESNDRFMEDDLPLVTFFQQSKARRKRKGQRKYR